MTYKWHCCISLCLYYLNDSDINMAMSFCITTRPITDNKPLFTVIVCGYFLNLVKNKSKTNKKQLRVISYLVCIL